MTNSTEQGEIGEAVNGIDPPVVEASSKSTVAEVLEDTPFTIKIIPSHAESFELQVINYSPLNSTM